MPSPIAHMSAGYVLFAFLRRHLSPAVTGVTGRGLALLAIFLFFSLLPDLDAVPGALSGDMGRYHNQWSHSIVAAIGLSALLAGAIYALKRKGFWGWLALFSSCYGIHILLDTLTYGRGCRIFWPFTAERFSFEHSFFAGLRWSEGVFAPNHIWTAIEELSFGFLLIATYYAIEWVCKLAIRFRNRNRDQNASAKHPNQM